MNDLLLKKKIEDNGFLKIKAEDFGLSVKKLSFDIMSEIKKMKISSLPQSTSPDIANYIDKLHENDCTNGTNFLSQVYQMIVSLPCLWRFASDTKLIRLLTHTLGLKSVSLGTVPIVRLDRSNNDTFSTPWHQDYWFSQSSPDSVVVWFPLTQMIQKIGFIKAIPNPSNYGILNFKNFEGGHEPYEPVISVDEKKAITLNCDFGDILIFKQSLLHRSGKNLSGKTRISCQLRFNKMYKQEFSFSSFRAVHSEFVKNGQKKYHVE